MGNSFNLLSLCHVRLMNSALPAINAIIIDIHVSGARLITNIIPDTELSHFAAYCPIRGIVFTNV